jgi:hypothetical protein
MKLAALATAAAWTTLAPAHARAGEAACWFEQGVVVVPASIAGLAGDYILDTGTAVTQLHETKAQGAGLVGANQVGDVKIAGLTLPGHPFTIVDLDARTWAFPTPIAGVIGADLLSGYVVDVSFAPCRVGIHRPGKARAFHSEIVLPLKRGVGVAVARAAVADGRKALAGDFVIATGADTPIRLVEPLALVPGVPKEEDILPSGGKRAKLRAASFAGVLFENLDSGLTKDVPAAVSGVVGAPLLSHWRLRFDFPRGRLFLARPAS